jgi:hypothetical protein
MLTLLRSKKEETKKGQVRRKKNLRKTRKRNMKNSRSKHNYPLIGIRITPRGTQTKNRKR